MSIKISNKKGFQISFGWLFAIIVGGFIISLAIYASVKLVKTEQAIFNAEKGKEFEILTNVLETGFESSKTTSLSISLETRIKNNCQAPKEFEPFGIQGIQLAQKNFDRWSEIGTEIKFRNRYIFSEDITEGKTFYLFSKSFEFPFEVSDSIYLTSSRKTYCFKGLRESVREEKNIKNEISNLNQENLFVGSCPSLSINICFGGSSSNCDIIVNLGQKHVKKREGGVTKTLYFETDSLMYGAIFSDERIYECQVERIMQRLSILAITYSEKEFLLYEQHLCPLSGKVLELVDVITNFRDSGNLRDIERVVESVDKVNDRAVCKLW